ncbi:MAG TPA: methylmalonyl-CoA mutase small subunit [Bacteroidales bacterium]|jgi:methylmalonyl-CoA mutase|nr:methylmalonyl-CoA mutase small subunit [Bacteroidales bacterium]
MSNQREPLFTDFSPTTTQEWMEVVTRDLKGADFQRRLVWRTDEGFNVNPFYRAEDIEGFPSTGNLPGQFPYVRSTRVDNVWYVRQEIEVKDFKEANKRARTLLERGITSLGFKLPGSELSAENVRRLLDGIAPDKVELNFCTGTDRIVELAKLVVAHVQSLGLNVMDCFGSIEFDPFGSILQEGVDEPKWLDLAVELATVTAPLPRYRAIVVSGNRMSNAGAYSYQELGYSLSYGNQLLGALIERGVDSQLAAKKIKFKFGVGANYFMEIAKFRAARWLWALIVDAYKPHCSHDCDNKSEEGICRCAAKMNAHAITTTFNQSVYDPYVNLLRTQTEAMSAVIGSVDSLTVRPFDEAFETPTDFAERIAANQQLLLKEESHFDKVTDPSSGSYYIETLTSSLAKQAWALFLETEETGFYSALKAGTVQDAINVSAEARFKAVANRREILLGTNQYPNFTEKMGDKIGEMNPCGDSDTDTTTGVSSGISAGTPAPLKRLNRRRLADAFNELRLATERSKKQPKVFMLTIGNLAMRLARSQFSSNFFACAGYEIIDNLGFDSVAEGVDAAREKGADVVVLCSSDDEYVQLAPEAYNLLKGGKELFVVAGAPACMEELKEQGVEHFIHVRSNVLETLQVFNDKLLS